MFLYDFLFLVLIGAAVLASRRWLALALPWVLVAVVFYAVAIRGLPIPYRFVSVFDQEYEVHGTYVHEGALYMLVSPEGGPPIHVVLEDQSAEKLAQMEAKEGQAKTEGVPLFLVPGKTKRNLSSDPQFYVFESPPLPSKE